MQPRGLPLLGIAVLALLPLDRVGASTDLVDSQALYPEGPLWRDGKLLYVEYAGPGIKMWDGRRIEVFWRREHCGPSGLIAYGHDHLLVACYDSNSIIEVDERGNTVRVIDKDSSGNPFVGPNDFAADGAGGVYFSASGVYDLSAPITGAVLHMSADGNKIVELANTIHYSNGLTLSKDGKSLLVAEDLAGRILSFPIRADGTLGPRTVWARLRDLAPPTPHEDAYNGPDGFKLGPDGNYYIAQNGSGRVLVVDEAKKLVRIVTVPTPYVTNVNFGADGARTLYITGVFEQFKAPYSGAVYRWTP
ncbi:MAG TPA: SMP-30/gluconolactonase/LRE family protein [Steroidobacteraceae bacterium]|nr:SMP-30/gluconolactonase/LRE family protein [Steroidobacteraceae bacterium]